MAEPRAVAVRGSDHPAPGPVYRGPVLRWSCALAAGAVVSGFAALLVTGEYRNEGPVLLTLFGSHGVHAGDLFVLAGWAVAVLALVVLAVAPGRTPGDRSRG